MQVWNLYQLAKATSKAPSEVLRIEEYTERAFGLNGWFYAVQVDLAVLAVGVFVENKLNELDKKGKPKYKLAEILKPRKAEQSVSKISRDDSRISPKPQVKAKNGTQ